MERISLFLFIFSLTACVLFTKNEHFKDIDLIQLDLIKLDQVKEDVENNLGQANKSYIIKTSKKNDIGLLIYNDKESQLQRAAISINISTNKVIGKTFVPKENELEEHFNYIFNDKFKDVKFVEIEQKKCLDFNPLKSYYFNIEKGLNIVYNRRLKVIESINWTTPIEANELMNSLQSCQKNESEMLESNW